MSGVVVLGANGFIGQHLIRSLIKDNVEVFALTRVVKEHQIAPVNNVHWIAVSDFSLEALRLTLSKHKISSIINLAAYGVSPNDRDIEKSFEINVRLPVSLALIAAMHDAVLLNVGSSAEYATPPNNIKLDEASSLQSHSIYGSTKAAGGLLARSISNASGGRCAHLRLFNVYGEGEAQHRLLPALMNELAKQQRVPLSQGLQIRDFIHVSDVILAVLKAQDVLMSNAGPYQNVWNVGTGRGTSVADFARAACKIAGQSVKLLGFGDIPLRKDDVHFLVANTHAIYEELGWTHTLSVEQGIALTMSNASPRITSV